MRQLALNMLQHTIATFATIILVVAAHPAPADVPEAVAFPAVSNNAALQYWQAFAMLPALDAKQEKILDDRATVSLDDAVASKLLNDSHASLLFLTRASKLRECDWGLDYNDGASMYLPHLNKARTLARIAALEARRAFEARQFDRAREMAFGMIALARQCGTDRTMVSMLVCYMIEDMAVDAVAPYVPHLGAPYEHAMQMYQTLPPSPRAAQGALCEKQMAAWIIKKVREAEQKNPGSWRNTWKTSILGPEIDDPLADVETFDEVLTIMNRFQSVYDQLSELANLPPAEFDAKYPAFVKKAEAASPIAKILLPSMSKVVAAQRRSEARMAMLLASIAVVEGGPEKLAEIKDPFGDGPFGYRKLDTGFELSSKLQRDGKPVTLVIGQKPSPAANP
jgi:hypothetical protein